MNLWWRGDWLDLDASTCSRDAAVGFAWALEAILGSEGFLRIGGGTEDFASVGFWRWGKRLKARRACIALPTPQIRVTGFSRRKPSASVLPITEKPRGFIKSEATFARNLLKESPIETVMPISFSTRRASLARLSAGEAP